MMVDRKSINRRMGFHKIKCKIPNPLDTFSNPAYFHPIIAWFAHVDYQERDTLVG